MIVGVRRGERGARSVVFYAFDLLRLNGKDLQNLTIEERKAKLDELLEKPPGLIRYWLPSQMKSQSFWNGLANLGWKS